MKTLTIPVLVTEGEKDGLVLASHTAHLLSCIAQAKHSLYEGIGHAPPMEDTERFNRELAEFARQHAG
jgi:pimeloyl-ACP methyl ester carboxylesterase